MACGSRQVRRHDRDPPSRRDPRGRCGGVFAADGADEEGMLERLKALRRELDPKIAEHKGRIPGIDPGTKATGDGNSMVRRAVISEPQLGGMCYRSIYEQ
jgi:hypothetical protein